MKLFSLIDDLHCEEGLLSFCSSKVLHNSDFLGGIGEMLDESFGVNSDII